MAVEYGYVLSEGNLRLSGYISLEVNRILSISTEYTENNISESVKKDSLFLSSIYIRSHTITSHGQGCNASIKWHELVPVGHCIVIPGSLLSREL